MAQKKTNTKRPIESYEHRDKERVNNPPVGLVTPENDPDIGHKKKRYAYDPHLDPQLVWAGKAEHTSFAVPTVSLHVHERIEPRTIIEAVRKVNSGQGIVGSQLSLFEEERQEPLREAIEFYQHKHGWSNRLIAGDSLLVMNSLLEKEGLAGKVQMIYIDPPYGIKYGSNFQPFVNKRDVKDGKDEDLTAEPEQIKAFRDTWELGIHSYLTYLRDRLLLARELLTESGSIFVQIGDENVQYVRALMDEVFGPANFMSLISFRTKIPLNAAHLPNIADYLIWYAADKAKVKFRRLYVARDFGADTQFSLVLLPTREVVNADNVPEEHAKSARYFRLIDLMASGYTESCHFEFQLDGRRAYPNPTTSWKTTPEGMARLIAAGRVRWLKTVPGYVFFADDYPVMQITNQWIDTQGASGKTYAVQTAEKVVQRCLLMTTDPGDLVFDPTCGSGTTAYVAEQWGRRWITCDTSRVALTLARQRLMTAVFDYYELAHPQEGVGSGFKYRTVPHVTLGSIANNPEIDGIYARMHPAIERALADLNAALKGQAVKFKVTQGGRAGHFVDFAASDSETFTMPSGQVVKVNELVEWEVPFDFPAEWPQAARAAFDAFHAARRAMQKEMDAAIARHAPQETLYDQPFVDQKKVRVTGPFTVEAVPAPAVKSVDEILEEKPQPADASIARSGETLRQAEWRDELLRTGIRGKAGQHIRFARLEPLPGCRWLHAYGEVVNSEQGRVNSEEKVGCERKLSTTHDSLSPRNNRVVVSFGPEHAPLEQRQVQRAWEEARQLVLKPKLLVFAAFQFDPEAAKDIDEMKPGLAGMQFLKVQMNADLLTDDLKKKRTSNESFWLIGQPDVRLERIAQGKDAGKLRVSVHGFDYYNTKTGAIESGGEDKIAVWLLDTDYDGRSLYPRQVFFPMAGENEGWAKLARNLKAEIDEELIEAYRGTVSLPFEPGEHKRIAVKIVDDRGIESLKVLELPE
ncbi:site-specific DNA-methyltransferase [Chloracidobacterium thermophilum]|uniref:site-specific DNA-methyltransferase n=1 Tax=Chloracidobacterium thermophilum TaxID=458033 RepID=UPI0009300C58|nr:site-specific DNA-methyltransferase [Chloracidobacterium thermophilum]